MGATKSPNSASSGGAAQPTHIRELLDQLVELARSVPWQAVSALVAVIFVLLRVVYASFYSSFGVAPEEVGLGFGQSLAQAAIGGIIVTVLVFTILLAYIVWVWLGLWQAVGTLTKEWRRFRQAPAKDRAEFVRYLFHRASIALVFIGGIAISRMVEGRPRWAVIVGAGLVLGWLFNIGDRVRNPLPREPGKREPKRLRRAVAYGFLLASVVFWFIFPFQAIRDADAVRDGVSTPVGPFVPWHAQRALVSWTEGTPPPVLAEAQGHCLMYLGQGNGVSILYDVTSARTLRLPSSALAISVRAPTGGSLSRCPNSGQAIGALALNPDSYNHHMLPSPTAMALALGVGMIRSNTGTTSPIGIRAGRGESGSQR